MLRNRQKYLVEVCPQCCKLIDSTANRLVRDTCGHSKCRICLLQEITGCLLCVAESKSTNGRQSNIDQTNLDVKAGFEPQPRKSVITSLAIQIAEQKQSEDTKSCSPIIPSVDKDTCHVIKQSLEKDILFPTEIVKRSTSNFYHLKRVFSQRFFNEDNNKKHKACETEEKWSGNAEITKTRDTIEEGCSENRNGHIPKHVQVQYYCMVHKLITCDKNDIMKNHMNCDFKGDKNENFNHQCKICSKKFKVISRLHRHMKFHNQNSRFKCKICDKSCTDSYALRTHERSHTQEKPYSCNFCEQKFSGLQNFKRHEKKHRNEKNFVCNECGFCFITKTELKRHGVTHTNVKSFVCSICSTKFTFKRTLVRHLRIHDSTVLRMKCPHCESTFKRKDNLERHIKTSHFELKIEKNDMF